MFRKKTGRTYFAIFFLAFFLTAGISEYAGDKWEEAIREFYYHRVRHTDVPANYHVLTDADGIPFVIYNPAKDKAVKQYLPTTISIYALDYYRELKRTNDAAVRKKFFNCIEWLASHITYHDNVGQYEFNWQQPFYPLVSVPWTSALSSGKAIEAFTRAYEITQSEKYLGLAKSLLRGFYTPIQEGGFTYRENNGWWYEEYADRNMNTPHVLNGHIYALLGVRELWFRTKDDSANFIYQKGIESLKNNLSKYDAGNGWSYYDLSGKKSDKKYHKLVTAMMEQLWQVTGDDIFHSYYIKWKAPLDEFYFIRIIKERNRSGIILFMAIYLATVAFLSLAYFIQIRKQPPSSEEAN